MKKSSLRIAALALLLLSMPVLNSSGIAASPSVAPEYGLELDPTSYTIESATFEGKTITYRAYKNLVYVKKPIDATYQNMNLYVPIEYYEGKSIGSYTAETAPILLPNTIGGYMPALAGTPGPSFDGSANAALAGLAHGYVVAEPGARGRTTQDESGAYTGKAPACIVDLKAAVRYLRYNAKRIPGDSEKIISNGTSAGGALSALLGATGNNSDYEPYLKELGAAETRDDIFAASCYCPITNLDHADTAYEWLFNGINDYKKMTFPEGAMPSPGQRLPAMPSTNLPKPVEVSGSMTADQIRLSGELKAQFPAYLNSLQLKRNDGGSLTLNPDGNGSFKEYLKSLLIASAQTALNQGSDLSGLTWLTLKNGQVLDLDFDAYVSNTGRMKTTPAFDEVDLSSGENSLFGTTTLKAQHFTQFSTDRSTAEGKLADAKIIKMMNPLNYIDHPGSVTSRYWRIRHGSVDRDTSLAVPLILATKLLNSGQVVDFAFPWDKRHSGDYDLPELFSWIDGICNPLNDRPCQ